MSDVVPACRFGATAACIDRRLCVVRTRTHHPALLAVKARRRWNERGFPECHGAVGRAGAAAHEADRRPPRNRSRAPAAACCHALTRRNPTTSLPPMPRLFPALSLLLAVAACSGSDRDASSALPGSGGDFFVFATGPPSGSQIYLNDSVFVTFTKDVDLGTANLNSVSFSVFDLNGNPLQEQPRGTFLVH